MLTAPAAAQVTVSNSQTATVVQNSLHASSLVGAVVVDGNKYAQTDAGIQAAINATPVGGTVLLPSAVYSACNNLPITISKSLNIIGQGWGQTGTQMTGSVISVCPTYSTSSNVLVIAPPSGTVITVRMEDFAVTNACSNYNACGPNPPGQYGLYVNGSGGYCFDCLFDHLFIGPFESYAIRGDGNGSGQGSIVASTIQNNDLNGGIQVITSGDTLRVLNNRITDNNPNTNTIGVDVTATAGSAVLIVQNNNITNGGGGVHLGAGTFAPVITGNEIEAETGFRGSNSAMIDCDGVSGNSVQNAIIKHNSLQVVSSTAAFYGVRLNYCNDATVSDNSFERGGHGGSADVILTANARNDAVGHNAWAGPLSDAVSNLGTNTYAMLLANNLSITAIDDTGTQRPVLRIGSTGTVGLDGFHGNSALSAVDGATYIHDGTPASSIALATSSAPSSAPVFSTVTSLANLALPERSSPVSGTSAFDVCYGDSIAHVPKCSYNNSNVHIVAPLEEIGSCSMSSATTCTYTLPASFTTPLCMAWVQGSTAYYGACSVTGTTATVTANANNSGTWAIRVVGNPN